MGKIKVILIICFCSTIVFGQSKLDTTKDIGLNTSRLQTQICLHFPDSLKVKDLSKKNENQSFLDKNIPWIVAFLIGLLSALVNFWVSHRLRQSNERNLRSQIESNERNIKMQIETIKETKLIEFKATIATKNRQEWINDVRHTLAEYISCTSLILPIHENPSKEFLDERGKYIQRMSLSKAKLELLLNKDRPEQALLLTDIENMLNTVSNTTMDKFVEQVRSARTAIINSARELFGIHWTKIKDLK
jgi:hypothetical protein